MAKIKEFKLGQTMNDTTQNQQEEENTEVNDPSEVDQLIDFLVQYVNSPHDPIFDEK